MDLNGENLDKLVVGDAELTFPTWSPDEKYVAYLTYIGSPHDQTEAYRRISFFNIASKTKVFLNTRDIITPVKADYTPMGSLSWIK